MSFRYPLPLTSRTGASAPHSVLFKSAELSQRLRITARQLQWWDEQGILPAHHEGHKRLYSRREAILAGVIGKLRKAGLGRDRLQTALRTLLTCGRNEELPRYLVVNWQSGVSYPASSDHQAVQIISTFGEQGVPSLLIDVEQIEHKLALPCFSF
jgi:MerR HTH family regulatory protein